MEVALEIVSLSGTDFMGSTKYRTSNIIIQEILEAILRKEREYLHVKNGIIKYQLIKSLGLKTTTAEKYLQKMEKAGYIRSEESEWGDRKRTTYYTTPIGRHRYTWFVKINAEIE